MKNFISAIALILVMAIPILACSDEKIEGVGENNVTVTHTKTVIDIDGNEIKVWDTEHVQSYGQDGVDEERIMRNEALIKLKIPDCQTERDIQIKKHEDALIRLDKVQAEIDKLKVDAL